MISDIDSVTGESQSYLRRGRHTHFLALSGQIFLIMVLTGIAYHSMIHAHFVWDDSSFVVKNLSIRSFKYWKLYFTDPQITFSNYSPDFVSAWRPVRNLSYALDYQLFKLNPMGWHVHNIILHMIAGILLLFLLRDLVSIKSQEGKRRIAASFASFLGAIWWTLQPVQTEVVCWVKSRDDLVAVPFALLSIILMFKIPKSKGRKLWILILMSLACYIAALLAKENSVVIPGVVALYFYLIFPGPKGLFRSRTCIYLLVVLAGITLIFLALRDILLKGTAQTGFLTGEFSTMMATMSMAWTRYLQLVLWPWFPTRLLADYKGIPSFATTWLAIPVFLGMLLLLASSLIALAACKRWPIIGFGWFAFLIMLLPFSNIVPMMQVMAERFLYMPTIGIAILLTGGANLVLNNSMWSNGKTRWTGILACSIIGAANLATTSLRAPVWLDQLSLAADIYEKNGASSRSTSNYIISLAAVGRTSDAVSLANKGLTRFPNNKLIERSAAYAYRQNGQADKAEEILAKIDNEENQTTFSSIQSSPRTTLTMTTGVQIESHQKMVKP